MMSNKNIELHIENLSNKLEKLNIILDKNCTEWREINNLSNVPPNIEKLLIRYRMLKMVRFSLTAVLDDKDKYFDKL